ncbi:MAG: hypothetical protein JXA21_01300 [Anaerolineae bacterium]|nr:hypothetical protein [Anaerolineae bacterium]
MHKVHIAKCGSLLCAAILLTIFISACHRHNNCVCVPEQPRRICSAEESAMVGALEAQEWLDSPDKLIDFCKYSPRLYCGSTLLSPERQSICWRLPLNDLFDLSVPGVYSVTLTRSNFSDPPNLFSGNPISFTITP